MEITPDVIREAWPEFEDTPDNLIEMKISEASVRVNADRWGDSTWVGRLYLTAHLLAVSPYGRDARLSAKDGSSTYLEQFKTFQRAIVGGPRVTGMVNGFLAPGSVPGVGGRGGC